MGSHTLHKKCPRCKRKRTFLVPEHAFSSGREWEKRDGVWVCYWCVARETPDGEAKKRQELRELVKHRKERNKKFMAKTKEWIKFHLLNPLSPDNVKSNGQPKFDYLVERVQFMFPKEKEEVSKMADHLVSSGQIVLQDEYAHLGLVKFESGHLVSSKAQSAAKRIYDDLADRRGIKNILWELDNDIREELLNTIAKIIDEEMQ